MSNENDFHPGNYTKDSKFFEIQYIERGKYFQEKCK